MTDIKFYKSVLYIVGLWIYASDSSGELAGAIILQERKTEKKARAQVPGAAYTNRHNRSHIPGWADLLN